LEVSAALADTVVALSIPPDELKARMSQKSSISYVARQASKKLACLGCRCRRPAKPFKQVVVVLRHSERRDYADPDWKTTPEGQEWPHDAPLTDRGIALAREVAEELRQLDKEAEFKAIAVSPYRRCLETAIEVARVLALPLLVDQELGEVWDRSMPESPSPHRTAEQIETFLAKANAVALNPKDSQGKMKLFGRKPQKWPESLEDAKARYLVRIETYITQSVEYRQNFLIVTHADAVATVLSMFQRGNVDVRSLEFCAQVTGRRSVGSGQALKDIEHGVFSTHWKSEFKRAGADVLADPGAMAKYYEKMHLDRCDEAELVAAKRKEKRTPTDKLFDSTMAGLNLKDVQAEASEEEINEEAKLPAMGEGRGSARNKL